MDNPDRLLVFIRHGESESNVLNSARYSRDAAAIASIGHINDRVDWQQRLTSRGREQAREARAALGHLFGANFTTQFSGFYASPYIRTCETGVYIAEYAPTVRWMIDDRLCERDWGDYGYFDLDERATRFPYQNRLYDDSYWFFTPSGGESLFAAKSRLVSFLSDCAPNSLCITHGDLMNIIRYHIERLLPEEFEANVADRHNNFMKNGTILAYRFKDNTMERLIYWPFDPENSPHDGKWVALPPHRAFTSAELAARVKNYPPLIGT
jgi:broad specificity phosphatase PhoE